MAPNPDLIQHARPSAQPPKTPLFLLHDGGGTVFSYHLLNPLGGRAVYGIHNPHFNEPEKVWTDGIPEMAWHYAQLIKRTLPPSGGDVILGGWSLGGCVSLEVAKVLSAKESRIRVLGIVMIDSVYPKVVDGVDLPKVVDRVINWSESTRPETKEAVLRCFDEAYRMVREWTLPIWDEEEEQRDGNKEAAGEKKEAAQSLSSRRGPPPVYLLRAQETVPTVAEGVARVDVHRTDRHLGWKNYREDLITEVIDIPGHHFNVFAFEHLDEITDTIDDVVREIESRAGPPDEHWLRPSSPVQAEPRW